jgi:hypothetical protein
MDLHHASVDDRAQVIWAALRQQKPESLRQSFNLDDDFR